MFANLSPAFRCSAVVFLSTLIFIVFSWHGFQTSGQNRETSRYHLSDSKLWSPAVLEVYICERSKVINMHMCACVCVLMAVLTKSRLGDLTFSVCCGWQRHFQSYQCESCHSSLNGTAVRTQLTSHLKSCAVEEVFKKDSAHLYFFFSHEMSGNRDSQSQ